MRIDRKSQPTARTVQKRGQMKKAHYTSAGRKHLMQLESRLEASCAIALGLDPRVQHLRSQPMTFDLATGRTYPSVDALKSAEKLYGFRSVKYTPDFEVALGQTKILIEVKHRELIKLEPKILTYPSILARYGYRLIVIDDKFLDETYVRNLRLLSIAQSVRDCGENLSAITAVCGAEMPYGDFLSAGFEEPDLVTAIAHGHLTFDIRSARLNHDTIISAVGDTAAHLKELPLVGIDS